MIKVITPFSFLNDDSEIKNGKIIPIFNVSYTDNISLGNIGIPFFVVFTDDNL
ncbi:MAG: hypothetical protein IK057_04855 [Clostridia bacterium]|nr:hypothetical protein [Clostridia bacterium]